MEDIYTSILHNGELQTFLMVDVTPLSNGHLCLQKRGVDVHNLLLAADFKKTSTTHVKQHHHEATECHYSHLMYYQVPVHTNWEKYGITCLGGRISISNSYMNFFLEYREKILSFLSFIS